MNAIAPDVGAGLAGGPGVVTGPILLYDGECGFCNGIVQQVLRIDRAGTLRFAALNSAVGSAVRRRHPEVADVDSIVWVDTTRGTEHACVRSEAALQLVRYLGPPWSWLAVGRVVPHAWRDAAYDAFARHRYRWFGRVDVCPIPTPEQRRRFVDAETPVR